MIVESNSRIGVSLKVLVPLRTYHKLKQSILDDPTGRGRALFRVPRL